MIGTMRRERKGKMVKRREERRRVLTIPNMVKIKTQNWVQGQC